MADVVSLGERGREPRANRRPIMRRSWRLLRGAVEALGWLTVVLMIAASVSLGS